MFPEDQGPAETAISFTDQFVEAAVARLDALFGAGYAKEHPEALTAYVGACASNLNAFMLAASSMYDGDLDEGLAEFDFPPEPEPKPKGRRR